MPAGPTYEPIASTTLGANAGSIVFSAIAASWTDLRLVVSIVPNGAGNIWLRYNSDNGANYSITSLRGNGSAAASSRGTFNTEGYISALGFGSTQPSLITVDIMNYAGSRFKTFLAAQANDLNGSGQVERNVMLWRSTSAITSVTIGGTFATNTTATLYGIKAA